MIRAARTLSLSLLCLTAAWSCSNVRPPVFPVVVARTTVSAPEPDLPLEYKYRFPENIEPRTEGLQELFDRTHNNGVCFSGGGTRSLSASMGQLRALHALGLVEKTRYFSSVSGGSWAAGTFTYYRNGAANDEEFLGRQISEQERHDWLLGSDTGGSWSFLSNNTLGHTATVSLEDALAKYAAEGSTHDAWQSAIGEVYYSPFGLYDPDDPKFFSLDEESVERILEHSPITTPQLTRANFHVARPNRPYLIVNTTAFWPTGWFRKSNKSLLQFSPLGAGNPHQLKLTSRILFWKQKRSLGGGFVDPFAFQSVGPSEPSGIKPPGYKRLSMPGPDQRFTLWRASGMSSAAYSAIAEEKDPALVPRSPYWAPPEAGRRRGRSLLIGDGGNLENFGIMGLLQRKVKHIVVFINTSVKLSALADPCCCKPFDPDESGVDSDLSPLFGYPTKGMPNNTVFSQADYKTLVQGLCEAKKTTSDEKDNEIAKMGRLPMLRLTQEVQANKWFGVPSYEAHILWVYNDLSEAWLNELSDSVQKTVKEGVKGSGPLKDFPHYQTIAENGLNLVALTNAQVTLLADMFDWSLRQPENCRMLAEILAPKEVDKVCSNTEQSLMGSETITLD